MPENWRKMSISVCALFGPQPKDLTCCHKGVKKPCKYQHLRSKNQKMSACFSFKDDTNWSNVNIVANNQSLQLYPRPAMFVFNCKRNNASCKDHCSLTRVFRHQLINYITDYLYLERVNSSQEIPNQEQAGTSLSHDLTMQQRPLVETHVNTSCCRLHEPSVDTNRV